MDIGWMNMTVGEYMDLEPCGNVHPNHPDVMCTKKGKCPTDWHMTEYTTRIGGRYGKYTRIVQWGKDIEDYISRVRWKSIVGELLPIRERSATVVSCDQV